MNTNIEVLQGLVEEIRSELHSHNGAYAYTNYEQGRIDEKKRNLARLDAALAAMAAQPEAQACRARFIGWWNCQCSECTSRRAAPQQPEAQAGGEVDELLAALGLDVSRFRTEGGWLNVAKVVAAIRNPRDYSGYYTTPPPSAVPEGMVLVRRAEVYRTIDVLRYAAHPHPSPYADYWAGVLAAAPGQKEGA